ncbi:hypothetical protein SH1V18_18400 [Vallitalea longa]|uniref:HTH araC/xylS-type domain-containing protein n=1 Tax=Vallitalea longa TaxID=2936439 RepID=A0A9W5YB42_9FIRM|nr:AraC family transcriptional regulator [Vallitalea longa]GKX29360.1 hypothetical protein SH1V18_18400 [Vallitalea longa]
MKKKLSRYQFFFVSYTLILTIPIIVLVITSYILIHSFIIDEIVEKEVNKTTFQTELLNTYYTNMKKIIYDANKQIFMTHYIKENRATVSFDIKESLINYENQISLVEHIYFYQIETKQVFSIMGTESEEFFFNNKIVPNFSNNIRIKDIDEPTFVQGKKYTNAEQQLFYIVPLEYNYDQEKYNSYMIFMIDRQYIQNMCEKLALNDKELFFIIHKDKVIYGNDKYLNNKFYYDDLDDIRSELGKRYTLIRADGDSLLYTVRFIEYKSLNHSVIFIGLIMGVITCFLFILGILFIKYVLKKNYKPILDTIYNVQSETSAINQSKDEYLIINQTMIDLIENKKQLQKTMKRLSYEKLFYQLLSSAHHKKELVDELKTYGVNINYPYFLCAILYQLTVDEDDKKIYYNFENDKNIKKDQIYIIEISNTQLIYIFAGQKEEIDYIYESLIDYDIGDKVDTHLGVGYVVRGMKYINQSYKRAQLTSERAVQENMSVCFNLDENIMPYPSMELIMLKEYLELSNLDRAVFTLNYLKEYISISKNPYVSSEIYWEVIHIIEEQYNLQEVATILGDDYREQNNITQQEHNIFINLLIKRIERIIMGINMLNEESNLVKTKHYKQIDNIINYIKDNYKDNNFSIKTMAAYFDTTSSNLSQYFKKSTGKNLSEYVDALKLKYAKKLLEKGKIRISDISIELGYSSPSAFIKKFKRLEGVTPGEYRQKILTYNK